MIDLISPEGVGAYTQCKRKAFFLLNGKQDRKITEYIALLGEQTQKHKTRYIEELVLTRPDAAAYSAKALENGNPILLNAVLNWEDLTANSDFLIRKENNQHKRRRYYEPAMVVGNYTVTKEQILQITFAGYVLSKIQGQKIESGTIITADNKSHRVKLETASKTIEPVLNELRKWKQSPNQQPPPVILNKHCPYCPFKDECYTKAKEIDHLSLLQGISKKEIEHQNKKGIFSVTQYSYTYRPRRKRKNSKGKPIIKHYHSLKALAIRNNQIYVVHKPEVKLAETLIFLDVEGTPDQNFYYLIGLVITTGDTVNQFSLWADNQAQEELIWKQFLEILKGYESFTLLHYGSYETEFIEKLWRRYTGDNEQLILKLKSNSINILSLIYANIYFPTYSNGLKDIGAYLSVKWSSKDASGLQSIVWRSQWNATKDEVIKQKLIEYNIEDCFAVKTIIEAIVSILNQDSNTNSKPFNVVSNESIKVESTQGRFGKTEFVLKELELINKCAYFDYQREKIFFRENKKSRTTIRKRRTQQIKGYRANKEVEFPKPQRCIKCNRTRLAEDRKAYKIVFDLRIFNYGVKRWIVNYSTKRVQCKKCRVYFQSNEFTKIDSKYGWQLKIWIVYQIVVLRQSYRKVMENLVDFFGYDLDKNVINRAKSEIAKYYDETYQKILLKLRSGYLIHADETSISIKGIKAYVWVFTSLEEVLFVYAPTREGEILTEILKEFNGVLVSDFYFAYDSIGCPQQKCLIHLIRDMNDDLLQNPFDEQYKIFVKDFGTLLKSIVDEIDKYGLKKFHLNKHKKDVERFFNKYLSDTFESEVLATYQKRLNHNQDKLFTFLNYDGIPWNNNNAEHAIKGFAAYRKINDGYSNEKGIKEYLTLLSIYKTCEYKNIDFLKFLRSGEKDIDKFRSL